MSQGAVNPICPSCEFSNDEGFRFCPKCRFPLMHLAGGKYRLERALAQGGMGQVYLAHHTRLEHDTERVVKVIKPEIFAAPGMDVRFRREVQVTAALSQRNDHIVRIYDDFGEEEGFGHYYVMEFLRGQTLRDLLAPGNPLDDEIAYHIFYQCCRALAGAHRDKIVHRDLKPDNIYLIKREEDDFFVKVIDFGIARPQDAETGTPLTQGALGTPQYMSPEQCENKPVDQRSDIYSMAMILYEMLSGAHAYGLSQDERSGSSPLAMITAHLIKEPIPLHEIKGGTSEALSLVLLKALSRSPEGRFEQVEDFWNAIAETQPLGHPMPLIGAKSNQRRLRTSGMRTIPSASSGGTPPSRTASIGSSEGRVVVSPEEASAADARSRRNALLWGFSAVGLVAFAVLVWLLLQPPGTDKPLASNAAKATSSQASGAAPAAKKAAPRPAVRRRVAAARAPAAVRAPSPVPASRKPVFRRKSPQRKVRQRPRMRRRKFASRRRSARARPAPRRRASGPCGAAGAGYRYVFATLAKPSRGRPRLHFAGCRGCRSLRRRGGYCLRVPDNDSVRLRISVNGYVPCSHRIAPATKRFSWRLKLEDPDDLADEGYRCVR